MTTAALLSEAPGLEQSLLTSFAARREPEPLWLEARRRAARERFRAAGLPRATDEAWRLTPLRSLLSAAYAPAPSSAASIPEGLLGETALRVALVNGQPRIMGAPAGLEIASIRDTLQSSPARLEPYLAALSGGHSGFAEASTAAFEDGACIFVSAGQKIEAPLELTFAELGGDGPALSQPRVLVVLEPNSELLLVESHVTSGARGRLTNAVSEIFIGDNATLRHVRCVDGAEGATSIALLCVRQSRDSRYVSRNFAVGGALTRLDLHLGFDGPGAEAVLDGLYVGVANEHVEQHVTVDHSASHCTSHQKYKGVLADRARGVFDGTIVVARGTKATVAHQENRNLVLSNEAIAHTKPHLEIDADDVKCSHGATVGRLDREQLFYLRSRGISAERAKAILTLAFAREMTDRVENAALRAALSRRVLERGPSALELEELA